MDERPDETDTADELGGALRTAAKKGDADAVSALLAQGAPIEAADAMGHTPLMLAAMCGRTGVVRLLCERGASLSGKDTLGLTALGHAAQSGRTRVASLLLDRGADQFQASPEGGTLLARAITLGGSLKTGNFPTIKMLLDHGADPNARAAGLADTPLAAAVKFGEVRVVRLLLERGADANGRSAHGLPILALVAARAGPTVCEVAALLLSAGADVDAVTDEGETALSLARGIREWLRGEKQDAGRIARAARLEAVIALLEESRETRPAAVTE